jgi:hypothetical protein
MQKETPDTDLYIRNKHVHLKEILIDYQELISVHGVSKLR